MDTGPSTDLILFVLLLILCVFGLVVIYSAGGQDLFYVKRQFVFMIAGFILMLLVAQFPARSWERWAFVFYGFGLVLLAAVLIFGGIWGLWGVFFAIPLATLVNAVIKAWPNKDKEAQERELSTPEP
mgnify:CR=1 FL=1